MDLRGVPHPHRQADTQPGTARHGLRKLSARPRQHAQRRVWSRILKKVPRVPGYLYTIAREKTIDGDKKEVWFSDEARRLVSARRTRSPAGGRSAAPARALLVIS